jgi:hypothetical protein
VKRALTQANTINQSSQALFLTIQKRLNNLATTKIVARTKVMVVTINTDRPREWKSDAISGTFEGCFSGAHKSHGRRRVHAAAEAVCRMLRVFSRLQMYMMARAFSLPYGTRHDPTPFVLRRGGPVSAVIKGE